MADNDRETKKPGLFGRLFGRGKTEPAAEAPAAPDAPAQGEVLGTPEPAPAPDAPVDREPSGSQEPAPVAPDPEGAPPSGAGELTPSVVEMGEPEGSRSAPVPPPPPPAPAPEPEAKPSWWKRLKAGLSRSSSSITQGITDVFTKRKLDDAALEDLEDILVRADLGVAAATRIVDAVGKGRYEKEVSADEVKAVLAAEVEKSLAAVAKPLTIDATKKPFVVLVVGVNGSGKTTTIAKLTQRLRGEGKSVILAAGDTFRAAAIEQLKVWGDRLGAPVIARAPGADAAGLAFDALSEARERNADVVLMDTAGRLQNRTELMAELEKIVRVMKKVDAEAPHCVLLVLDATVGQNALSQVEIFGRVAGVTGLVMTKLDGTARGGILVAIADRFGLPVHFIGVGESADDLEEFAARDFARAIAGLDEEKA